MKLRTQYQLFIQAEGRNDLMMGGDKKRNKKKDQYNVIKIRFFFLNFEGKCYHTSGNDTKSPQGLREKRKEGVEY